MITGGPWQSVFKLGGSLMDYPAVYEKLATIHESMPQLFPALVVVGGARSADLVRYWDKTHEIGEAAGHRLAMEAMRFNSKLLHSMLPASQMITTKQSLFDSTASWGVVDPIDLIDAILQDLKGIQPLMQAVWPFTSDSIAAWLASHLGRLPLTLLKSTLPDQSPDALSLEKLSQLELVDRCFPESSVMLKTIRIINLRSEALAQIQIAKT